MSLEDTYVEGKEHITGNGKDVRFKYRVAQIAQGQREVIRRGLERDPCEQTDLGNVSRCLTAGKLS